ncbi:Kinesin-like protein kif18a [Rhizoclosmatium hyalinum]|nr:Kinesin-like protein kif18a [Rhizoclosmatium hyalinum]
MKTAITAIIEEDPPGAIQSNVATKSVTIVNGDDSRLFQFDQVYNQTQDANKSEILSKIIQPLVKSFLSGMNVTLVLFGSTTSQKLDWYHSPPGTTSSALSIFLDNVFTAEGSELMKLEVTALQIYGELVRDMLNAGNETITLSAEGYNSNFKGFVKTPVHNAPSGIEIMSTIMNYTNDQRRHQLAALTDCITFETERDVVVTNSSNESTTEKTMSTFSIVNLLGAELLIDDPSHILLQEGPCVSKSVVSMMNAINTFSGSTKNPSFDFTQSNLVQVLHHAFGGNSITSCMVFLKSDESWEQNLGILKVSHKIGKIYSYPTTVTTGIRNMIARIQSLGSKEYDGNVGKSSSSKQLSGLQQEHKIMKRDFELLQSYVLELTTRLNNLQVTNASLEASCKTTEKDRLSMKNELLDSKIELSRSLERLENVNIELSAKLASTERKAAKLEAEVSSLQSKRAELEDTMNTTTSEKEQLKSEKDTEHKKLSNLNATIRHLEMKNKELTVELIGIMNNKASFETKNGSYKSELERLRKHNEYLKKKMEISQKSSFNMGHEIERLLEKEQEKLRKEVATHQSLKERIAALEALNEEANSNLELVKETFEIKEASLIESHKAEITNFTDRLEKITNELVDMQQANIQMEASLDKWQKMVDSESQERNALQKTVNRLQEENNVMMEQFRSKLERLTADVLLISQKGGKSADLVITANQLFKEMLDSYVVHEKQLKNELTKTRNLLKTPRVKPHGETMEESSKLYDYQLHKKIKEFTMNVQQKLEMDRTRLLTRAIVAEEMLKQHAK